MTVWGRLQGSRGVKIVGLGSKMGPNRSQMVPKRSKNGLGRFGKTLKNFDFRPFWGSFLGVLRPFSTVWGPFQGYRGVLKSRFWAQRWPKPVPNGPQTVQKWSRKVPGNFEIFRFFSILGVKFRLCPGCREGPFSTFWGRFQGSRGV